MSASGTSAASANTSNRNLGPRTAATASSARHAAENADVRSATIASTENGTAVFRASSPSRSDFASSTTRSGFPPVRRATTSARPASASVPPTDRSSSPTCASVRGPRATRCACRTSGPRRSGADRHENSSSRAVARTTTPFDRKVGAASASSSKEDGPASWRSSRTSKSFSSAAAAARISDTSSNNCRRSTPEAASPASGSGRAPTGPAADRCAERRARRLTLALPAASARTTCGHGCSDPSPGPPHQFQTTR